MIKNWFYLSPDGSFSMYRFCGIKNYRQWEIIPSQVFNDTRIRFRLDVYPPLLTLRDRTVSIIW